MKTKIFLTAALAFLAGSIFFISAAFAYGGGTQAEKYPQIIPKTQFAALAEEKIKSELAAIGETRRYELTLTRSPQSMRCPVGRLELKTQLTRDIRYGSVSPVYISVYVDDDLFRRVTCYYRVNVYDNVIVAKHDLPLEKDITPDDLRIAEKEIADRSYEYLTEVNDAVGKVPSRVIREGTAITKSMLQNPLVVEVGAPVVIVSDKNGIRVQAEGIALMRGRTGKIIRVRNTKSRKVLRARVIDATTVEVL